MSDKSVIRGIVEIGRPLVNSACASVWSTLAYRTLITAYKVMQVSQ